MIYKINEPVKKVGDKYEYIDKDTRGKIIDSRPKTSKSVEVEGDSRFCGKRFILGGKLYGDKKCLYCGKWFHWKDTDYQSWMLDQNIDRLNLDNNIEPIHCGSDHCKEYHHITLKYQAKRQMQHIENFEQRAQKAFKILAGKI